ncbi:RNA recognition motif family protein [Acanthocheilonema viteae]
MTERKEIKNSKIKVLPCKSGIDPEDNSKAILIKHIPFGFFEKELLKYFLQFGAVRRVRLPRNKKTGNHKGWAFVLFTDSEVAQLAAEAMDGYLMFEKRLECKIIKNKNFPPCLCKGPRIISPPLKYASRKRHAKKLNKMQSGWCEEMAEKRLLKKMKIRRNKFAELGYQLPPIVGLSETKQIMPMKDEISIKSDDTESQVKSSRMIQKAKSKKVTEILVTRKIRTDMVKSQRKRRKVK